MANVTIQLRRGQESTWKEKNPILAYGEPGYVKETGELKIGDGKTPWNELSTINNNSNTSIVTVLEIPGEVVEGDIIEGVFADKDYEKLLNASESGAMEELALVEQSCIIGFTPDNNDLIWFRFQRGLEGAVVYACPNFPTQVFVYDIQTNQGQFISGFPCNLNIEFNTMLPYGSFTHDLLSDPDLDFGMKLLRLNLSINGVEQTEPYRRYYVSYSKLRQFRIRCEVGFPAFGDTPMILDFDLRNGTGQWQLSVNHEYYDANFTDGVLTWGSNNPNLDIDFYPWYYRSILIVLHDNDNNCTVVLTFSGQRDLLGGMQWSSIYGTKLYTLTGGLDEEWVVEIKQLNIV